MQATKETAVLAYAAAGVATVLTALWNWLVVRRSRDHNSVTVHFSEESCAQQSASDTSGHSRGGLIALRWQHLSWSAAAAIVVTAAFYTSFGSNPRGLLDGMLTYLPWLDRAGGQSPHIHPWYFYFHRIGWWQVGDGPCCSEGLILVLAAIGGGVGLVGARSWRLGITEGAVRWLVFYTVVLAGIYTVIPYKTPWCLLQFLIGLILLAGIGAATLLRATPGLALKATVLILLLAAWFQLGWQSYRAAFVIPADPRNPYVNAHTQPDILRLANDLDQLIAVVPAEDRVKVKVIWTDDYYWPLPWYLRGADQVEYWNQLPDDPQAPIVLSSPPYDRPLTEALDATHLMTGYYGVRPNVLTQLWVRMDVWEAHLHRLGRL
jgi:predicted membrane-bound mannosyltransferase